MPIRKPESPVLQCKHTINAADIFPPPGPDRRDSFFAKTVPATENHARTYVGIAAQGRSLKVVLLRTYLALLGYMNSLQELGGSRRIVEDEVNARLAENCLAPEPRLPKRNKR